MTCPICGRRTMPGITESGTLGCFRLGYERSQEALAAANAEIEMAWRSNNANVEALAAARRECDLLRAEAMKWIGCPRCEFKVLHRDRQCSCVCHNTARRVDALASPAAGEEGKR